MNLSTKTRWILALLFLSIGALALAFAPPLHNAAFAMWGLSLALLIAALVVAVKREREERSPRSRGPGR